jgi:hypothetical protein
LVGIVGVANRSWFLVKAINAIVGAHLEARNGIVLEDNLIACGRTLRKATGGANGQSGSNPVASRFSNQRRDLGLRINRGEWI